MTTRRSFLRSLLAVAAAAVVGNDIASLAEAKPVSAIADILPVGKVATGEWTHVAVSRAAGAVKMYMNGSRVGDIEDIHITRENTECIDIRFKGSTIMEMPGAASAAVMSDKDYTIEFWVKVPEGTVTDPSPFYMDELKVSTVDRYPTDLTTKSVRNDNGGFTSIL